MITVTILTKNSQKYLTEVLEALSSFNEVLIYDNGSKDETLEIAKCYANVSIFEGPFMGFGPTHNLVSSLAANDWILSIDSDEVVTATMAQEIHELKLEKGCVYSFPRDNYYNGKHIKWCGWHPDRQTRLYNRQDTEFTKAQVHESIKVQNLRQILLSSPIIHYSYDTTSDFLQKMQSYSTLFALQNRGIKSSSLIKAVAHGLFSFLKSYFIKKGFLGGFEGFVISIYNANTAFYKYLKLAELNKRDQLSKDAPMPRGKS